MSKAKGQTKGKKCLRRTQHHKYVVVKVTSAVRIMIFRRTILGILSTKICTCYFRNTQEFKEKGKFSA